MTLASFNIHSFIKLKFKLVWAGVLLVLASVVPQLEFAHAESSVVWRDSRFIFVSDSVADNAIAWGSFQDSISSTGWGILNLQSSSAHSDYLQAAALGFLEGVLTRTRIAQMWESVKYLHGRVANMDFLGKHNDYIRSQIKARGLDVSQLYELRGDELVSKVMPERLSSSSSSNTEHIERVKHQLVWIQTSLLIAQLDGLRDGFNSVASETDEKMTSIDALLFQFDADSVEVEQLQERTQELLRQQRRDRTLLSSNNVSSSRGISQHDDSEDASDDIVSELLEMMTRRNRCTALIKLTKHELLVAHSTWEEYTEMLRIYKHIKTHFATVAASQRLLSTFSFKSPTSRVSDLSQTSRDNDDENDITIPAWRRISLSDRDAPSVSDTQQMSFSSYPGFLTSSDDFYILSSGLTVTETTLTVLDGDILMDVVKPMNALLGWQRHMIANRLARSPAQWIDLMATLSSKTMSSQWLIIDYQRIRKAQESAFADENDDDAKLVLPEGSVIVAEELPGFVITEDVSTEINEEGYFAGFNLPRAGESKRAFLGRFASAVASHPEFNYGSNKRARLIARDQHRIRSVLDMGRLLRSNNFAVRADANSERFDSITNGCACDALGARCDLPNKDIKTDDHDDDDDDDHNHDDSGDDDGSDHCDDSDPVAFGATDVKVTSASDSKRFTAVAVSGPSQNEHANLPPFSWSSFQRIRERYIEDHPAWSKDVADDFIQQNSENPRITKSFGEFDSRNSDVAPFIPPHFGQPDTFDFDWIEMKPAFK